MGLRNHCDYWSIKIHLIFFIFLDLCDGGGGGGGEAEEGSSLFFHSIFFPFHSWLSNVIESSSRVKIYYPLKRLMKQIPFFRPYLLDFHANKYYPHLAFVSRWTNKLVLHFLVVESDFKSFTQSYVLNTPFKRLIQFHCHQIISSSSRGTKWSPIV